MTSFPSRKPSFPHSSTNAKKGMEQRSISPISDQRKRVGFTQRKGGDSVRIIEYLSTSSETCRRKKIADTYGSLYLGSEEHTSAPRSLYNDAFKGFKTVRPDPIYPKASLFVDSSVPGDFTTVAQTSYVPYNPSQRVRGLGPDKQEQLQSYMPLAQAAGGKFTARSEKQDQFAGYKVVYNTPK